MANKTISVHTTESNIKRLDDQALRLRRSRNSLLNEAIEILLEVNDRAERKTTPTKPIKKAGTR